MGDMTATDNYRVLLSGGEGEIVEKKSRFISTIRKCETEEEAVAFIEEMKKKYWDARHNCSAFIIGSRGELTRCSDDGEPSGTAGRPMLDVLTGSGIRNIAVVVTRYFGGTLLGTGGLVRAYTQAVKEGLDHCETGIMRKGFSIMNTASYNLKDDDIKEMDQEGNLMRKALRVCKTVQDFEHFLDTLPRPMRVEANFGVIDAYGGAAYYETNNERYYKKDANDPNLAPEGYLIYTNFSFEGRTDEGKGYVRYENAKKIFKEMRDGGFTPQRIFQQASRSFYNSLLDIDLMDKGQSPNNRTGWFVEQDFIPRLESTASIVIQGVRSGMNPELTTMWTALGYPPTSVAIPLWVKMGKEQSALVTYDASYKTALLDWYSVQLQKNVYSIHRGNGQKYLHWQLLWNDDQSGYIQQLRAVENRIFDLFDAHKTEWEQNGLDTKEIQRLYKEVDKLVNKAFLGLQKS